MTGVVTLGTSHAVFGFDPMQSNSVREFTEVKRSELISIVHEIENGKRYDPTWWDVVYRAERFFGRLNIENYQSDMRAYYRKVVDVEGAAVTQVNQIILEVYRASHEFQASVEAGLMSAIRSIASAIAMT